MNIITEQKIKESGWQSIHIGNPEEFDQKIHAIRKSALAVITDFDRTLTTHRVDGEERPSLISVLRSQNILSDEYTQAAYTLFDHFHPIEIDSSKSIHERSEQMETWWKAHLDLLTGNMTYDRLCELTGVTLADSHDNHHISVSLRQEHIIQAINSGIIRLRSGIGKFLSFSERNHIPFVIFSANVLGSDSIRSYLSSHNLFKENIFIISNEFIWNTDGVAIGRKSPVIHTFNKEISAIQSKPDIYAAIAAKKDIVLFGDSIGDAHMADGHDADTVVRVGFLTKDADKNLEPYLEKFDIVFVGDGGMDAVAEILGLYDENNG